MINKTISSMIVNNLINNLILMLIEELKIVNLEDINKDNKPILQKRFELLNFFDKPDDSQSVRKEQLTLNELIEINEQYIDSRNDLNYLLFDERMSLLLSKLVEKEMALQPNTPKSVFLYKYNK
jgi:hypothetical protein